MDFETELARVAEEYRSEGYAVTVRPRDGQVPRSPPIFIRTCWPRRVICTSSFR
jgi:hypothetical protein